MSPKKIGTLSSFAFAAVMAAILGAMVSATATLLAPRITLNREVERKKHVLITTRLLEPDSRPKAALVERLYRQHIVEEKLVRPDGERPIFRALDEHGRLQALCIPLAGLGLWGPIKGYLALDASGRKILRITFYEHRETPGLGSEISNSRWTTKWTGKSIVDDAGRLTPVVVKKGKIDPLDPWEAAHSVDGISGATISGNAVARSVSAGLNNYLFYLEERWNKN